MRQLLLGLSIIGLALLTTGGYYAAAVRKDVEPQTADYGVRCGGADDSSALADVAKAANGRTIVIRSGQTCSAQDIIIPNLRIEEGGRLNPITGHSITLTGNFDAGRTQVFTNALPGQGRILFNREASVSIYPQWWQANAIPGTTDMTTAIQAALTSTQGLGRVFLPAGTYLITASLTLPEFNGDYSPLSIEGEGAFSVSLINRAPPGSPTLVVNRDAVTISNIGFWGHANYRNDGIQIYRAHRIYVQACELMCNGNAITLQETHSIFIQNNFGLMSGGAGLRPQASPSGWSFAPNDSFVFAKLPPGGFANHIVINANINEGYGYQINTSGPAYGFSWTITGNQFEGSDNGLKLNNLYDYEISGNYLGEGGNGYSIDMTNCRRGRIGPNYIHFQGFDSKVSTVKLHDVMGTTLLGSMARLYITGVSLGLIAQAISIERLQDETTDHLLTINNSVIADVGGVPLATLNRQTGRATWYSDSTEIIAYPGARLGDMIIRTTPKPGTNYGWVCTTASSPGRLEPVTGHGPNPITTDYAAPAAYDFRLTILRGGSTGTATYKVEWKPAGAGTYADLTNATLTTELAHLIKREIAAGPLVSFSVQWPTSQQYVAGDQWTLTHVVPPNWTEISRVGAQ